MGWWEVGLSWAPTTAALWPAGCRDAGFAPARGLRNVAGTWCLPPVSFGAYGPGRTGRSHGPPRLPGAHRPCLPMASGICRGGGWMLVSCLTGDWRGGRPGAQQWHLSSTPSRHPSRICCCQPRSPLFGEWVLLRSSPGRPACTTFCGVRWRASLCFSGRADAGWLRGALGLLPLQRGHISWRYMKGCLVVCGRVSWSLVGRCPMPSNWPSRYTRSTSRMHGLLWGRASMGGPRGNCVPWSWEIFCWVRALNGDLHQGLERGKGGVGIPWIPPWVPWGMH